MRAQDLTAEQLTKLRKALRHKLHYFRQLKSRMLATHFPDLDRMLRSLLIAEAGLNDLLAEVETYLSYRRQTSQSDDLDPSKIF